MKQYKKYLLLFVFLFLIPICILFADVDSDWMKKEDCVKQGYTPTGQLVKRFEVSYTLCKNASNVVTSYKYGTACPVGTKKIASVSGQYMYGKSAREILTMFNISNQDRHKEEGTLYVFIKLENIKQDSDNADWVCCKFKSSKPAPCTTPDGKYIGKNGIEVTEEEFRNQCIYTNPEIYNKCKPPEYIQGEMRYYGSSGKFVTKEKWEEQCLTGGDGSSEGVVDPEECPNDPNNNVSCPTKIEEQLSCGGVIKEPSLCSLIDSNNMDYKRTDNDIGNEYCEVYCRKEMQLNFQNAVQVLAGRYFKHSLTAKEEQIKNLSAVITATYECGGQIKYQQWKKDYKKYNEAMVSAFNEYSKWLEVVNLRNKGEEVTGPKSYSCEAFSKDCGRKVCASNCDRDPVYVWKPKLVTRSAGGPKTLTLFKIRASYTRSTCTSDCNFLPGTSNCTYSTDRYIYISGDYSDNSCSTSCKLENGIEPSAYLQAAKIAYENAKLKVEELEEKIKKCNHPTDFMKDYELNAQVTMGCDGGYEENYTFGNNYNVTIESIPSSKYKGTETFKKIEVEYNKSGDWKVFCGECDSEFKSTGYTEETITKYECDAKTKKCTVGNVIVPSNGAFKASMHAQTTHYQKTRFSTQLFTGNVIEGVPGGSYMEMDEFSWPIAADRKTGDYDICYDVSNLEIAAGYKDIKGLTCIYSVTNELNNYDCSDEYDGHECYGCSENDDSCHDGKNGDGTDSDKFDSMGVFYRSVDLTDLFPNSKFSPYNKEKLNQDFKRVVGFNWINKDNTINTIQATGESIWTSEPEVTVTLTPAAIKKLKENNNVVGNYLDLSTGLKCYADSLWCENTILSKNSSNNLFNILGTNSNGEDNLIINGDKFKANRYEKSGGDN